MANRGIPLVRILGFDVRFDLTWLILVALVVWTLSAGYFPRVLEGLPTGTYIWMAILGAIGIFASIIIHELAHSLVARRFGMEMRGITLFVFGGAAHMPNEPPTPEAEFWMAIAGPISSVALAVVFWLLAALFVAGGLPDTIVAVVGYLAGINLILAIFNMVPGFPLDGGRVLRAILWWWKGDLRWATRVAAAVGGAFGITLVLLGVLSVLYGNLIGGMWLFLIGLFLRAAASSSYQALLTREALSGEPASAFMTRNPVTVTGDTRLSDLVDEYFLGRYLKAVPVTDHGRLVGIVDVRRTKDVPREEWPSRRVGDVMKPVQPEDTVRPEADAMEALQKMQETGGSRVLVADGDRLVGIISLSDLRRILGLRTDLLDTRREPRGPGRPELGRA